MTPDDKPVENDETTDAVEPSADVDPTSDVEATTDVQPTAEEAQTSTDLTEAVSADDDAVTAAAPTDEPIGAAARAGVDWPRVLGFIVLPVLALLLGAGAGFLKWQDSSVRDADVVRIESLQFAKDATVKLLSYQPNTVEQDLGSARDLLTGEFKDSYTELINDVVIPGAQQQQISAVADVPAVASVSAEPNKAVVLVFVNQTVVVGGGAPTATTSSVQMTMDRVGDRWLISEFEPI